MAFREHPGFSIKVDPGLRRPKGVSKKQTFFAERAPLRGDRAIMSEQAIWLNPRYRAANIVDLKNYINGR